MDFKLLFMMCKLTCGLQQGAGGCLPSGLPSRRLRAGSAACRTVWVVHESQFTTVAGGTGRQHCQRPMPAAQRGAAPPKGLRSPRSPHHPHTDTQITAAKHLPAMQTLAVARHHSVAARPLAPKRRPARPLCSQHDDGRRNP